MNAGQRFARVVTDIVVRRPALWRLFRGPVRKQFDRLAPQWSAMRRDDAFVPVQAALDTLPSPPRRALDLGTGTGAIAALLAQRYRGSEVVGVDLAPRMIEEARRTVAGVRFEVADARGLPFSDGEFDLVTLGNMIPFFDELARVTASGGHVVFAFSAGNETPIYVPPDTLRRELGRRGFADFADFSAGRGTALLGRKE